MIMEIFGETTGDCQCHIKSYRLSVTTMLYNAEGVFEGECAPPPQKLKNLYSNWSHLLAEQSPGAIFGS